MGSATIEETELEKKRREAAEGASGEGATEGDGDAGASGEGATGPATHEGGEGAGSGDFEGEGEGEAAPAAEPRLAIEGAGQLSLKVGGASPDKSTVKLRGGSIEIPKGQYAKGEVVNLLVKVQVAEVHLVDKIDNSTGEITGTERRHVMKMKGVEKV